MDVFIVEKGSKHEGGGVVAAFSRYELAEVCAQRLIREETAHTLKCFRINMPDEDSEREREAAGYGVWKQTSDGPKYWEWQDATESVSIRQMPVLNLVIP
jgi:hypothetical protein